MYCTQCGLALEALTEAGIHNVYFESAGTAHEWLTWGCCFNDFAPRLFRQSARAGNFRGCIGETQNAMY